MTTVTIFRQNGLITGFKATGHAGDNDIGKDIVCASVSTLTQSAMLGIIEVAELKPKVTKDDKAGRLELCLTENNDKAQTILRNMELALENLREQYPKHIQIKGETK